VLGDAPRFDRLHVGDVDRLTTPRALGLVVSTEAPPLRLGAEAGVDGYGELGGGAMVEYGRRLFRRGGRIYGGDVFVGAGLWALASRDPLASRDAGWRDALPVGAVLDAGVRIDTEVGVFEFTLANALGRVPW
jgi:hypothetical protein